jgi:hypothetical protein
MHTSILYCHRAYIVLPNADEVTNAEVSQQETEQQSQSADASSHFTRKRTLKWQRYDALGSDSGNDDEKRRGKKQRKSENDVSTPVVASEGAVVGVKPSSLRLPQQGPSSGKRTKSQSVGPSAKAGRASPSSARRPSKSALGQKKVQASSVMELPKFLENTPFRWKASHIFSKTICAEDPTNPMTSTATPSAADLTSSRSILNAHVLYEGEVGKQGATREGLGVCRYENGNVYEGWWRRNKEHGKGILMTGDRRFVIYEGDWERGRMHGKGIYYYASDAGFEDTHSVVLGAGDVPVTNSNVTSSKASEFAPAALLRVQRGGGIYKGDFKENLRHGFGAYSLSDGSFFEGEWRDNVQNGRGMFQWKNGSVYDGQWKDGIRYGQGTLKVADGFFYEGQWGSNSMDGRGYCVYPDGQRYEGMWAKGKKEGRGTIVFPNGAVYEGRFKDDEIEGQGTMKISSNVSVPRVSGNQGEKPSKDDTTYPVPVQEATEASSDWLMPLQFQSDMSRIHQRAGFTKHGS